MKLESLVATKTSNTLMLAGLGGLIVAVDSRTEYEGVTGIANLQLGTYVSVRGRYNANQVIATRIEAKLSNDKVVLQGPVTLAADPTLALMGISVITSDALKFDGTNDRNSFFATVSVGDVVSVEGKLLSSGIVNWESIELEK